MTRGKCGQSAAVRHEVQSRDAEIAKLTHERDRARAEGLDLADACEKLRISLGTERASRDREIAAAVYSATTELRTRSEYAKGRSEGVAGVSLGVARAYAAHLVSEHDVPFEVAVDRVNQEAMAAADRKARRKHARSSSLVRGREVSAAFLRVADACAKGTESDL